MCILIYVLLIIVMQSMYASVHIYSDYTSYYGKYESGLGNVKKKPTET